ncbi:carbon-nitrogen hydrolase [Amniculicola lignicola CBS 123094]|uniref:Carbon-nitrogen hydrolase n=1 Tax=Amniculicola lignicola CBS 123094 TaxID=1392246 RepID=A0A6A5WV62_9PLEO|nr:carbon-nitrogen hydrolase [Amniculicola lignicola CBS 123094]
MKVACLQFAPELGKVQENIRRAEEILQRTKIPPDLDWLVLPEMAFSGYNFHSLDEIRPYLEPTTAGITTQWAIRFATHYACHVTVGYPELTLTTPPTQYNSTVTVSPTGAILANYRKTFLYYTDETWSSEGDARNFFSGELGTLGKVTLGICMDINPYKFIAPWTDYEFANTAINEDSQMVCVSMAWLTLLTPAELLQDPAKADFATIAYWVERFQPLVEKARDTPVYVILANRCGTEKTVCYAGSSTILKVEKGGVSLYETLGKNEEKCLVVDLNESPKFQVRGAG